MTEAAQDSVPFLFFALSVNAVLTRQRKLNPACRECTVCGSLHSVAYFCHRALKEMLVQKPKQ